MSPLRFLIDNTLSPTLADGLAAAGHDAVHVGKCGIAHSTDPVIFDRAKSDGRIVVSADTAFGTQCLLPTATLL